MAKQPKRVRLTAGRVESFACAAGKSQDFLWDTDTPTLALRASPTGRKTYIFESRLNGATLRISIGTAADWPIGQARIEAQRLKTLVDKGQDPREIERQKQSDKAAAQVAAVAQVEADRQAALTVGEIWPLYLQTGKPKRRDAWKPRYLADLKSMSAQGGVPKQRGQGLTRPGPLYPLMALALASINEDVLQSWFDQEAMSGKHQAARALMMFRGFLRWCTAKPAYRALADREAGKSAHILDQLPSTADSKRKDALQADQVRGWWEGVEQLSNRTASAYLRAMLLTGARREELATLTWANVDFQWRKLTIADKVVDTRNSHAKVLQGAGIEKLTIHGLRRSFSLLGEAAGAPAGAIAQVMGHQPSATAEGYRPRSIDALRPYTEKIEAHILSLANVQFDRAIEPGKLRAVG